MKHFLSVGIFGALLAFTAAVRAQVNVEIVLDQEVYLRSESMPLRVRVSNFSGQTLSLGGETGWLNFTVNNDDGKPVTRPKAMPPVKPFTLEASKTVSLRLDLMPYFDLSQPGGYSVTVKAMFPQLQSELTTDAKKFQIMAGTKIYEQEVGVPGTTPPLLRHYSLQKATFQRQPRLYSRVTDEKDANVLRVQHLGPMTSSSQPEALVDKSSNLHVLFQNGQHSFLYTIVGTDGELFIRQTFDYVNESRPHLRPEDDGRVAVHGGQRRLSPTDLPPAAQLTETNGAKPVTP